VRIVKAFLILIAGLVLFTAIPPLVNDVVHNALFDPRKGVNEQAALWAAMAASLLKGAIAVYAFRLAYKAIQPAPVDDNTISVGGTSSTNHPSRQEVAASLLASTPTSIHRPEIKPLMQSSRMVETAEDGLQRDRTLQVETNKPERRKAKIAIEYNRMAELAWVRVQALPQRYQDTFLSKLETNPTQDAESLAKNLEAEYQCELRPRLCGNAMTMQGSRLEQDSSDGDAHRVGKVLTATPLSDL
jgi:hypothetical protein